MAEKAATAVEDAAVEGDYDQQVHLQTLNALLPADGAVTSTAPVAAVEPVEDAPVEDEISGDDETTTSTDDVETSSITDEMVRIAGDYGYSPEDARKFSTPEQLMLALRAIDRAVGQLTREQSGKAAADGQAEVEAPKPPEPFTYQEFDIESLKEEFDEPALELAAKIKAHTDSQGKAMAEIINELRDRNEKLQGRLESIDSSRQADKQAETSRIMDKFFAELPEEYRDEFGTQPLSKLPESSAQRSARINFYRAMTEMQQVRSNLGQQPLEFEELQDRTLKFLYADRVEEMARKKVTAAASAKASKTLLRPTGRDKAVSSDPRVRAASAAQDWFAKHKAQLSG